MRKVLAAALLFAGVLSAQMQPGQSLYVAYKETALTATAEKVTVQGSASVNSKLQFVSAVVYCSVACDITVSQNGTAATTTTLAVTPMNMSGPTTATAYSVSNVGAGSTVDKRTLAAGAMQVIDLSQYHAGRSTAENLSIGTTAITGTARIAIYWQEQ